jgi:predicted chitinase
MQPIVEGGGIKYLKSKKYYPWYGRGYVQLTWEKNYQKFRDRVLKLFNSDIVDNADLAMRPDIAAFIMFEGMIRGEFTGKKLSDYFTATKTDWLNARRIINGVDRMTEIAGIAKQFYADLAG